MMLSLRDFWRRHKKKIFVTVGVLGSGYVLYQLYSTHKIKVAKLDRESESQFEADELLKAHLQSHFENIQNISNTVTLPPALQHLRSRILEELDVSDVTEKLSRGKSQPSLLAWHEKLELWERLKILSFTRTLTSLWAVAMLNLQIRVLLNISGRHLYIDSVRGLETADIVNAFDSAKDGLGHGEFLTSADYLSNHGLGALILDMRQAVTEVLKDKKLNERLSLDDIHQSICQILNRFASSSPSAPCYWMPYLLNQEAHEEYLSSSMSPEYEDNPKPKLEELMIETYKSLSSDAFATVADAALRVAVISLMEDLEKHVYGGSTSTASPPSSPVPLAKLLAPIVDLGSHLLEEPRENKFIQTLQVLPEANLFYVLLYANAASWDLDKPV